MVRTAATLVLLLLAQFGVAEAATHPPKFNIKSTCRQAQPLGANDKDVYQGCVQAEVEAQQQLAKQWRTFEPDRSSEGLVYFVFDLLHFDGEEVLACPCSSARRTLRART
jgi:hypothetical protein